MSDPTMGDRLSEIKERLAIPGIWYKGDPAAPEDIAWLIEDNDRLRAELAYLRDHPGWVAPQTGSQK